jgi:ATP-dependent Lon protease
VKNKLDIHPVRWIEQVLEMALERKPEPLPEPEVAAVTSPAVIAETGTSPAIKH